MIYILIVLIIFGGEYLIKNYIEVRFQKEDKKDILNGKITLQKFYNKGAMLNFMDNKKEIVKTVSGVCLGLLLLLFAITLPKKGNKLFKLGLAFVLGGAISNVSDRYLRGYVVDYFSFNTKKFKKLKNIVFNLADIAIFLGAILICLSSGIATVFQGSTDKSAK